MSITAFIGAVTHFAVNGMPDTTMLFLCVFITLVSAEIAAVIANKINPVALKQLTGILMVCSGGIMFLSEFIKGLCKF